MLHPGESSLDVFRLEPELGPRIGLVRVIRAGDEAETSYDDGDAGIDDEQPAPSGKAPGPIASSQQQTPPKELDLQVGVESSLQGTGEDTAKSGGAVIDCHSLANFAWSVP